MKKSNAKAIVRSGLADKKVRNALLYIHRNILNHGYLAGMDIQDQIREINLCLDNWFEANISKRRATERGNR